jgi:hypothetical protein
VLSRAIADDADTVLGPDVEARTHRVSSARRELRLHFF